MALTEFEIIERYFAPRARRAVLGVGDDAALVRARRGMDLAVSTDMLVEERHFARRADPARLGHKALAVNLSDMAAMGAVPRWATLSIALPRADARWLGAFAGGFLRLARRHGVELVGGDTTRGPLNICVQILGEVPAGRALRRDRARAGDDVWVSGTLGDAALALAAETGRVSLPRAVRDRLSRRLHAPEPRLALGAALRDIARAAIDISDGLAADLGHICERSRLAAVVRVDRLPVAAAIRGRLGEPSVRAAVLAGGDDYELAFTAPVARRAEIGRLARRLRLPVTRVGWMTPRRGASRVTVLDAGGRPLRLAPAGYTHF